MINSQFFKYVHLLHEKYTRKPEYNLFRVLRSESDEVRLHSRFLCDLLNPKGSHNHNNAFLKLFLKHFKDNVQLDLTEEVTVENEYKNIDILIRNNKTAIIIENKIYASDQEKQLSNYYRKMKDEGYENIKLIYLTPTGYEPSEQSTDELPDQVKETTLTLASYEHDIYEWITKCTEFAARDAPLREACIQYLDIISKITSKIENEDHMEELKTLLLTDSNLARFPDLTSAYNEVLVDLQLDIWNKIAEGIRQEFGELYHDSITEQESPIELVRSYVENRRNSKYYNINVKLDTYRDTYIIVEQDHHIYFGIYCENGSNSTEYKEIAKKTENFINSYQWNLMPIGIYVEPQINFKNLTPENLNYLKVEANRKRYADYIVDMLKEIMAILK
ncbi:PD-(D/E)XK nuclease family protein [Vibrio harveyi]|uniref:PDDEXK-like family protein n=1 Tax=Vibrio TaxID=662 RepID=UPI0022CD2DE0|nr:PD-(D/E)XK nuclease family protein [Vibrio sp. MM46]MDA0125527.1 PD-(D/E)XK nuclease family protein [Vibrio sp. MM46]